jgi:hypothetical protein
MSRYWELHDSIAIGGDARAAASFELEEGTDAWRVRQVLHDPAGDLDWAARFEVDLAASDEAGTPVVRLLAVTDT